jgi:hypothetical protein
MGSTTQQQSRANIIFRSATFNFMLANTISGFPFLYPYVPSIANVIKHLVGQPRPSCLPDGYTHPKCDDLAFPSGHSVWSVILLTTLMTSIANKQIDEKKHPKLKKAIEYGGLAINILVMSGRIAARKHWLGDVIAGAYVGLAVASTVSAAVQMLQNYTYIAPEGASQLLAAGVDLEAVTAAAPSGDAVPADDKGFNPVKHDLLNIYTQLLAVLTMTVSNPLGGAMWTVASLTLANTIVSTINLSYANENHSPLSALAETVFTKTPLINLDMLWDTEKRNAALTREKVATVLYYTVAVGMVGLNAAAFVLEKDIPFTMYAGVNTALEHSLYAHNGNDLLGNAGQFGSWTFAVASGVLGLATSIYLDCKHSGEEPKPEEMSAPSGCFTPAA